MASETQYSFIATESPVSLLAGVVMDWWRSLGERILVSLVNDQLVLEGEISTLQSHFREEPGGTKP